MLALRLNLNLWLTIVPVNFVAQPKFTVQYPVCNQNHLLYFRDPNRVVLASTPTMQQKLIIIRIKRQAKLSKYGSCTVMQNAISSRVLMLYSASKVAFKARICVEPARLC